MLFFFFFSSRRRHTIFDCDWSSDVCSSDLFLTLPPARLSLPQKPPSVPQRRPRRCARFRSSRQRNEAARAHVGGSLEPCFSLANLRPRTRSYGHGGADLLHGRDGARAPRRRQPRSEERRVGKECRSRWSPY